MAKDRDNDLPAATIDPRSLVAALKALPPDELGGLLQHAGLVPSTAGMTPEMILTLVQTMGSVQANTIRETLRAERKENPNYPEKSVFLPRGRFNDRGEPQKPKSRFRRPTVYCGIRLMGELETEEEIDLCNRLTGQRTARNGDWEAFVENEGTPREILKIKIPAFTLDQRMEQPLFTHVLYALIEGEEAINPDTMMKRIQALEAQVKSMGATPTEASPAA